MKAERSHSFRISNVPQTIHEDLKLWVNVRVRCLGVGGGGVLNQLHSGALSPIQHHGQRFCFPEM